MSTILDSIKQNPNLLSLSPSLHASLVPSRSYIRSADNVYYEHYTFHQSKQIDVNYWKHNNVDNDEQLTNSISNVQYYSNAVIGEMSYSDFSDLNGVSFDKFKEHLINHFAVPFKIDTDSKKKDFDLIFPGLKCIDENIIVFELPPSMRHVSYQEAFRDNVGSGNYREFYIPVPWQVYIATFSNDMRLASVQMYFSKTSLYSSEQKLYAPPLFNFYSDGTLCRPFFSQMEDIEKYPKTYSGIMASAFDWIWNSGFNWDITENITDYFHSKKFISMKPFLDVKSLNIIKELETRSFSSHGTMEPSLVNFLFSFWQQVPLEKVLELDWNSFCIYEDFIHRSYQGYARGVLSEELNEYLNELGITLVDEYETEDDCEDENIITYENISELSKIQRFLLPKMKSYNSTFKHAFHKANKHARVVNPDLKLSLKHLYRNRIYKYILSKNNSDFS